MGTIGILLLSFLGVLAACSTRVSASRLMGIVDYSGVYRQKDILITSATVREQLRGCMELHRDAGFDEVFMAPMVCMLVYHTKVDKPFNYRDGLVDALSSRYRFLRTLTREVQMADPLAVAVEEAHRIGLGFWGGYRMNDNVIHSFWSEPESLWPVVETEFHKEHPQYWLKDEHPDRGVRLTRPLSYAYDEVRRYVVDLLMEQVAYGVDGLLLDFMRFEYVSGFDPPALKAYSLAYGGHPSEEDERWWRIRAGYVNALLSELRTALGEVGKPDLPLAIRIPVVDGRTHMRNQWPKTLGTDPVRGVLYLGFDLATIAEEGLVDLVVLGKLKGEEKEPYSVKEIMNRVVPFGVRVYACYQDEVLGYNAWKKEPKELVDLYELWTRSFRGEGVDGLALYESEVVLQRGEVRQGFRTLKNRDFS